MRVEVLEDDALPERVIRDTPEIRERLLRRAGYALDLGQQVAELDEETAEALALVLRQGHDAGDVVALGRTVFLLAEVADEVAAVPVVLRHRVKEERLDVVVEGLVVEEQLGQQAQVLAVDLVDVAVDLEIR